MPLHSTFIRPLKVPIFVSSMKKPMICSFIGMPSNVNAGAATIAWPMSVASAGGPLPFVLALFFFFGAVLPRPYAVFLHLTVCRAEFIVEFEKVRICRFGACRGILSLSLSHRIKPLMVRVRAGAEASHFPPACFYVIN
jgi:hypothetical protein